jgi:hypothetical protein
MITGADQRPVAAPLILMGIASVDKIPRYVYIILHKVLCTMICNMSLYLCRAENVLGHVLMMLCFAAGNSKPTLPHRFGRTRTAMELLQIPARGGATEVGCSSSTSGCGGMGGASHGMSLWQKLSRGARNEQVILDDRGSGDAEAAHGGA